MRLSEEETKSELQFIDILFTRDAVMQFGVWNGLVAVTVSLNSAGRNLGRCRVFQFRPEHAACLAEGIQRVCRGDDVLTRAFTPISDQLLDMVGRLEWGDARKSRI
jgi:hypothetical protein